MKIIDDGLMYTINILYIKGINYNQFFAMYKQAIIDKIILLNNAILKNNTRRWSLPLQKQKYPFPLNNNVCFTRVNPLSV